MGEAFFLAFEFAFISLVVALVVWDVVGDYICGNINALQCALFLTIFIVMIAIVFAMPSPVAKVVLSILTVSALVLRHHFFHLAGQRIHKAIDDTYMTNYRAAIEEDPTNLAARSLLANSLYKQGRLDEAISTLQELVERAPDSYQDAHRLKRLIEEREEQAHPPVICIHCRFHNPPGAKICGDCGREPGAIADFRDRLRDIDAKRLLVIYAIWVAAATIALFMLSRLNVVFQILVVALLLIAAILYWMVRTNNNSS
jgi:ribosomal protein L40E